jgi:hypothetical protein
MRSLGLLVVERQVFDLSQFANISDKILHQFAKISKVSYWGKEREEIIASLIEAGHQDKLEYLDAQFQYSGSATGLTICKPEAVFPKKSETAEAFINSLIEEKYITRDMLGKEWEPPLKPQIQICGIKQDGSDVYLKLVEEKISRQKQGYGSRASSYAHFTAVVIHFGDGSDQVIEVRCAHTYRKSYVEYVMRLLGFVEPYKWYSLTTPTKEEAKQIASLLSAGLASTHVAIPSTVGSVKFHAKKGVDLWQDQTFGAMMTAIKKLGLPTDDTMEETCNFTFQDPVTGVKFDVTFEMNLKTGSFKFTKGVSEKVIETVLDAFIKVCYIQRQQKMAAAASEKS